MIRYYMIAALVLCSEQCFRGGWGGVGVCVCVCMYVRACACDVCVCLQLNSKMYVVHSAHTKVIKKRKTILENTTTIKKFYYMYNIHTLRHI
jgi:hypothetical protein